MRHFARALAPVFFAPALRSLRPVGIAGLAGCCALLAACTGGSGTPESPVAAPPATPKPHVSATPVAAKYYPAPAIPTSSPFMATASEVIAAPTAPPGGTPPPIPIALPTAAAGFGGSFALPGNTTIPPNTAVVVTATNVQPANIVPLDRTLRPFFYREDQAEGTQVATIEFLEFLFSNQIDLATYPSFAFTLPPAYAGGNFTYYLADIGAYQRNWNFGFEGPGVVDGSNVSFSSTNGPFVYYADTPTYVALYAIAPAAPLPTPQPSSAASAAPTAAPFTISPSSVSLLAVGATAALTIADPTAYGGAYAASVDDTTVATAAVSGTTITVTAVAAGSTGMIVSSSDGREVLVPITVTTSTIPVQ